MGRDEGAGSVAAGITDAAGGEWFDETYWAREIR